MEKINDIVEDSIRFAFDGLSDEHDTYVEYLTDKENKYDDVYPLSSKSLSSISLSSISLSSKSLSSTSLNSIFYYGNQH